MKKLLFLSLFLLLITCKKNNDLPPVSAPPLPNNNEIHAKMLFSSGDERGIDVIKESAKIGCDKTGGGKSGPQGSYIAANQGNSEAYLFIQVGGSPCITGTGTFRAFFDYYPIGMTAPNRPHYISRVYSDTIIGMGSITYTLNNDNKKEGSFLSVCKNENGTRDSVIITGTFKGDFISN